MFLTDFSRLVSLTDLAEERGYLGIPWSSKEVFDYFFSFVDSAISELCLSATRSTREQKLGLHLKGLHMQCLPSEACYIEFLQGEAISLLYFVIFVAKQYYTCYLATHYHLYSKIILQRFETRQCFRSRGWWWYQRFERRY